MPGWYRIMRQEVLILHLGEPASAEAFFLSARACLSRWPDVDVTLLHSAAETSSWLQDRSAATDKPPKVSLVLLVADENLSHLSALRRVRETPPLAQSPVAVCLTSAGKIIIEEWYHAGANSVIHHPSSLPDRTFLQNVFAYWLEHNASPPAG